MRPPPQLNPWPTGGGGRPQCGLSETLTETRPPSSELANLIETAFIAGAELVASQQIYPLGGYRRTSPTSYQNATHTATQSKKGYTTNDVTI